MNQLLVRRIKNEIHRQFKILSGVTDLHVLIYFIVPALLLFGVEYALQWSDGSNSLLLPHLRETHVWFILCAFLVINRLRTFVKNGDMLILHQNKRAMQQLRIYGLAYAFMKMVLGTFFLFVVLWPALVHVLAASAGQIVQLAVLMMLGKFGLAVVVHFCKVGLSGWKSVCAQGMAMIVFVAMVLFFGHAVIVAHAYHGLGPVVMAIAAAGLAWMRIRTETRLPGELTLENRERSKWIHLLYRDYLPPKTMFRRQKPSFIRTFFKCRSAEHVVAELYLKSFLRSGHLVGAYVQFSAFSLYAVVQVPVIVQIIVLCATLLLLLQWFKWNAMSVWHTSFLQLHRPNAEKEIYGRYKAAVLFALPFVWLMLLGIGVASGWGRFVLLAAVSLPMLVTATLTVVYPAIKHEPHLLARAVRLVRFLLKN